MTFPHVSDICPDKQGRRIHLGVYNGPHGRNTIGPNSTVIHFGQTPCRHRHDIEQFSNITAFNLSPIYWFPYYDD